MLPRSNRGGRLIRSAAASLTTSQRQLLFTPPPLQPLRPRFRRASSQRVVVASHQVGWKHA
eukprot:5144170-Amphidinium_carterae.2